VASKPKGLLAIAFAAPHIRHDFEVAKKLPFQATTAAIALA
jgi:hypothetical protein